MLAGRDVLGQAQTGTGKTAAFALPLLSQLELERREPQALILVPTRELAIQVAEALQRYAAQLPGFHVLPIYGGQSYTGQLRALARGVHVVVGTPGRVIDHLGRGTLKLSGLNTLVLDEADEMLRMGFVDDVEEIMSRTPPQRRVALFSATMPREIQRIAETQLNDPARITITPEPTATPKIRQRMWPVSGMHKLDALTRILEGEEIDGVIVFVRTKLATVELAERLAARGHEAVAINGDMDQRQREQAIEHFRAGRLDVLVATDVVARGIDVDRVSHVINYDIPHDTQSYVHRIGRTGRAGRKGEAVLFVAPRERRMLFAIERTVGQRIERMTLPSVEQINDRRMLEFKQSIAGVLEAEDESPQLPLYRRLIAELEADGPHGMAEIAAALAVLLRDGQPLLLDPPPPQRERAEQGPRPERGPRPDRGPRPERAPRDPNQPPLELYWLGVGHRDRVEPRNIVGAIANEAGLDPQYIGRIDIREDHSHIELPEGMPKEILRTLKKTWVSGQQLRIRRLDGSDDGAPEDESDAPQGPRPGPQRAGKPGFAKGPGGGKGFGKGPGKGPGKGKGKKPGAPGKFGKGPGPKPGKFAGKKAGPRPAKPAGKARGPAGD